MKFSNILYEKKADLESKMDCYIPNNPQFGISVEYTTQITPNYYPSYPGFTGEPCETGCQQNIQSTNDLNNLEEFDCDCEARSTLRCDNCETNCERTNCEDCETNRNDSINVDFNLNSDVNGDTSYWSTEDLGSLSLSGLDIDNSNGLFPCSPCTNNHKSVPSEKCAGENLPNSEIVVALKHHTDCTEAMHSSTQMMMPAPSGGSYPYYEQYSSPALFPTMSVNVSMNMTMHSYAHDQVQWNQPPTQSVNMVYPQSQNMLTQPTYQGPTYSITADFRTPQSDPLITSTSFITSPKFRASPKSPELDKGHCMKTRSKMVIDQGYQYFGEDINECGFSSCGVERSCGGRVQVGALSNCSGSEDEQKPNLCRICGKTYARPSTLKTHLRTHSGERPYRCGDCNKSFSQAANLTAHVRTHTGQKPFRCPICDRRFSQSSSVTTHMRTHSGERPYRCRSCKKAFSDSSTLTKHLRIHSGEKPYQCKLCLLRFSQSGNLNRHMRVHGQASMMD